MIPKQTGIYTKALKFLSFCFNFQAGKFKPKLPYGRKDC